MFSSMSYYVLCAKQTGGLNPSYTQMNTSNTALLGNHPREFKQN